MTFQEAKQKKEELRSDQFTIDKLVLKVYIVPSNPADFINYASEFEQGNFTDQSAVFFSSDNDYLLRGIANSPVGIIHRHLPDDLFND